MTVKRPPILTILFLVAQIPLYYLILTAGGSTLRCSEYAAIVLCFVHILLHIRTCDKFILGGLLCTVGADFCLVVCSPIQQLWGMVFFLAAQTLYALKLHRNNPGKGLIIARIALIVAALSVTILVLRENTDPLALVSLCYYANLIFNIIVALTLWKREKLFAIALILFLLCDTVIGLQVAARGYLPIAEGSILHRIIFMSFNLSWFFYLPSQVLISICGSHPSKKCT